MHEAPRSCKHEMRTPLEHAPQPRLPLATPPRPASAPEVDLAVAVDLDALGLEQLALDAGPEAVTVRAASGRAHHALPRHAVDVAVAERAERHADRARRPRLPEDRRHLAVSDD